MKKNNDSAGALWCNPGGSYVFLRRNVRVDDSIVRFCVVGRVIIIGSFSVC